MWPFREVYGIVAPLRSTASIAATTRS